MSTRGFAAIGAVGLMVAIPLTIVGSRPSMDLTIAATGLAGFALGLFALTVALCRSPQRVSRDLAGYQAELLNAVRRQWRAEEMRSRLHDPMPIPVRWRLALPALGVQDHWANVTMGRDQAGTVVAAGTIADLAESFLRLPSRRLVIIGPPGAGKTTLVTRLLLDLIDDGHSPGAVPVLLSVNSWDPRSCDLHGWLASCLVTDHAALGADAGDGRSIATALVEGGHIMPVLDGLDEMPPALRPLAIRRLNESLRLDEPVVLTCRTREYVAAVTAADAITAAGVVELLPLALADIAGYLPRTTRPGPGMATKWDIVLARLRDHSDEPRSREILRALRSPLMISLAREAYSDTDADPGVLFAEERFAHAEAIALHLLDLAVPVAYQAAFRQPERWEPKRPQRWLANLAGVLSRTGRYSLAWWQLMDTASRAFAAIAGGVVGVISTLALSLPSTTDTPVLCLLTGAGALVGGVVGLRHRPSPTTLQWRAGGVLARLRRAIPGPGQLVRLSAPVGWLPWIVGTALLIIIVAARVGWVGAAVCAAAVLLVRFLDLWFDVPAEVTAAPSPEALLRADRTTALSRGLLRASIVGGTVAAVSSPAAGLGFGLSLLLASVAFTAWGRFTAIRYWYALRGRLPWRLARFLDDAATRGVLRRMGAVYQFRHAELQDRLARTGDGRPGEDPALPDPMIEPHDLTDEASYSPIGEAVAKLDVQAGPGSLVRDELGRADGTDGLVVILTALELEYGAVRAHLEDLRPVSHPAGTLFEIGALSGCRRSVVLSVVGEGNQTAAVVTERVAAMFAPRALLFVGIAGALQDDIALGDVVVATRVYSYQGGRDEPDGFKARPRAWDASHELEQLARYISRVGTWAPPPGTPARPVPSVHFKPIAAGEVVLSARGSAYGRLIEQHYNDAAAVEMESAGMVRAAHLNKSLPALVIRGISDRADADKATMDKAGWQRIAAANAAAFTLSLVASLP